jgi:peptidoglycan-associated lipoprotein
MRNKPSTVVFTPKEVHFMRSSLRSFALPALVVAALAPAALVAACGSDPKPVTNPTNPTDSSSAGTAQTTSSATRPVTPETVPNTGNNAGIRISDAIRQKCGISETDAFFAFDSKVLRPSDTAILDKVALCFVSGPLKGQTLSLVGRADPRGEPEYNMELGHQRADSVGDYLTTKAHPKMDPPKVEASSQGAIGATGHDEAGWAQDRRVDVDLKQ